MNKHQLEERAKTIMRRLGFAEVMIEKHFKEPGFLGTGGVRITRADRQLISIGRAFVMNPEVIILHKPTAILDLTQTAAVLEMFREYVENRGLFMPASEPLVHRRKRTLIYSAKSEATAVKADRVYIAAGGALRPLKLDGLGEKERLRLLADAFKGFLGKEHIDHEQEAGMSIFKRGLRAAAGATGRGSNNNSHRGRSKSREDAKQRQQQQTTAKKDKADNNNETEGGEEGETGNSCSGAPKKPKQARSRNPLVGK